MQLRDVNQRSLGHSNQKLWPKVDLGEFHHVYPHEHFKSCSTDRLWVYNAEIFFLASFDHIKSAVRRTKLNSKKKFIRDTLICSVNSAYSVNSDRIQGQLSLCYFIKVIQNLYRDI